MNKQELERWFKSVSGKPDRVVGAVVRPRRDAQVIKEDFGIGSVIAQTRGDIDHGASGYVAQHNRDQVGKPEDDQLL
jgi:hypothetical protein